MASSKKVNFENALSKLNEIVTTMEKGELPLEKALAQFEQGVTLAKQCQEALTEAEQKVAVLTEKNGELNSEPLTDI